MQTEEEFNLLYSTKLMPVLETLEKARRTAVNSFMVAMVWIAAVIVALLLAFAAGGPFAFLLPVIPLVFAILKFSDFGKKKNSYALAFKEQVIGAMVKAIDAELTYAPQSMITTAEYIESGIFRESLDRYLGDDLVAGKIKATAIKFSEVHHQQRQVTYDSKGNRRESWVTIFRGIFFIADFNKNFNGRTFILPDAGNSFLGLAKLFEKWSMGRGELVALENPDFEKSFTVYGNDQVEARYILSTSLMARLVLFRQKMNTRVYLSFVNSKVFVAVANNKELFEPRVFSTGINAEYLKEYYLYFILVIGIVDDLNLNLRIWSKQ
jgi:hypothetical protein